MNTNLTNIIDLDFRVYSQLNKYPFSDSAILQDVSGRAVPYTVFIDAIVYPETMVSDVYISRIFISEHNGLVIEVSNPLEVMGYCYHVSEGTCYIIAGEYKPKVDVDNTKKRAVIYPDDIIIGQFLLSSGVEYLKTLAEISQMVFDASALLINPIRIKYIPVHSYELSINGTVLPNNMPVVFRFEGDRFIFSDKNNSLDLDITVDSTEQESSVIKKINNITFKNNKVWLSTEYKNSDIRIITNRDTITLLHIGDD